MQQDRLVETPATELPAGFERGPSGLLVPVGTPPLEQEGWRWEDGMAMVRAQKIAALHGLRLLVGCEDNRCAENPLVWQKDLPGGGWAWVCGHKERLVTKGPTKRGPHGWR